jgi:hypothetical protein
MPDSAAYKVATRFLYGVPIADPKDQLHKFQDKVEVFCDTEELAKSDLEKIKQLVEAVDRKDSETADHLSRELKLTSGERFTIKLNQSRFNGTKNIAQPLFWSILQQYQLPSQLRRSIEAASRFWSRSKLPSYRPKYPHSRLQARLPGWSPLLDIYDKAAEELEHYLKLCFEIRKQVSNAQAAIVKGKLHADPEVAAETQLRAGSFTLINTGDFKDDVMAKAADAVIKSEKAMRGIGQGKVCYGDILVSKTVNNKRNVPAFYLTNSDELFIRANIPSNWNTVSTVCHELTHRLQDKFLQSKKHDIVGLYAVLKTQHLTNSNLVPEEYLPKRGEELIAEDDRVTKVIDVNRYKQQVKFMKEGDPPNVVYVTSLLYWLKMKGIEPHQIDYKGFITKYAATNPEENFCEMVSYYALGKLPKAQIELLEPILL